MLGRVIWTIVKIVAVLLIVGVIAAIAFGVYADRRYKASLPMLEGRAAVAGLDGPVSIVRDTYGVPHIFGETDADVFFGLGYAHAQDRLFQMEMGRRLMAGRLAEIIGAAGVASDKRMRLLGYHLSAEAALETTPPAVLAEMEAYAAGVNAVIDGPRSKHPPELQALGVTPEPWTPADTYLFAYYLADDLGGTSGAYDTWVRERLGEVLTPRQLDEFLRGYPENGPTTVRFEDIFRTGALPPPEALAPLESLPASEATGKAVVEPTPGSNAWVVSGERTITGKPLLANDPHLSYATPSIWYMARLELESGPVVGGTSPGVPYVILGRNDRIAWGFTNGQQGVVDFVPVDQAGPQSVRAETIAVRFGRDVTFDVVQTPMGPIADPTIIRAAQDFGTQHVRRSLIDDPDTGAAVALSGMMRAKDIDAFVEAASVWTSPIQNMHYADVDGTIAFYSPGRYPIRKPGETTWSSTLPIDDAPLAVNPPSGFFANANNKVVPDGHLANVPGGYSAGRIDRIIERVTASRTHDVDSFRAIQLDVRSSRAERLLPLLAFAEPQSEVGLGAKALLMDWDGEMETLATEPILFAAWHRELARAVWGDELGEEFALFNGSRDQFLYSVLEGRASPWCDVVTTQDVTESCALMMGVALDVAVERMIEVLGEDMDAWRWGDAHEALYAHPLSGVLGPLARRFDLNTRVRAPGDGASVNVSSYGFRGDGRFTSTFGASLRAVYDLSDLDASVYVFAPGQSGHPLSPHYRDLAPMWASGNTFEIRADWDLTRTPPGARVLRLEPAG